jgi:hypothetical protein
MADLIKILKLECLICGTVFDLETPTGFIRWQYCPACKNSGKFKQLGMTIKEEKK